MTKTPLNTVMWFVLLSYPPAYPEQQYTHSIKNTHKVTTIHTTNAVNKNARKENNTKEKTYCK